MGLTAVMSFGTSRHFASLVCPCKFALECIVAEKESVASFILTSIQYARGHIELDCSNIEADRPSHTAPLGSGALSAFLPPQRLPSHFVHNNSEHTTVGKAASRSDARLPGRLTIATGLLLLLITDGGIVRDW